MSNEQAVPQEDTPKYLQWLNKEGYELETTFPFDGDSVSWTRKTRFGGPKCTTNKDLFIVVTKIGEVFTMSIRASTLNYWGSCEIYNIAEDFLVARGRQLEHRLVDAWRELSA